MTTLAVLRVNVRFNLESRTDISDVLLTSWVNQTIFHVGLPEVYRHPQLEDSELVTMVAGTNTYNLVNTNTKVVEGVRNTRTLQGYQLLKKPKRWFRERVQDQPGRPSHYVSYGSGGVENIIQLWPTPDTSWTDDLEVEEYLRPDILVDPANESPYADDWDETIIYGATWRGFMALGQPVKADTYKETYGNLINDRVKREKLETLEDPMEYELRSGASRARTQRL